MTSSNLPPKRAAESVTESVQVVMPNHLNGAGRIFGGQLVAWIDVIGGIAARRHCGCAVTTAAIDNLQFREPVYVNEVVVLRARVTFVGRTSMEVRVDTFVEDVSGTRKLVNTAYLTEIALGADGHPTPVPPLLCETMLEKAEFEAGRRRRERRLSKADNPLSTLSGIS